jgi:tetratricopeptide (TPR) repeat protein
MKIAASFLGSVLAIAGCIEAATAQVADGSQKQTDAIAAQTASQLRNALHNSRPATVAVDRQEIAANLRYNVRMSDCENRWVALYRQPDDRDYTYGFVYIDPQAGFTLQYVGRFTIDDNGDFREAPNPIPADKFNLKIRLEGQNGVAALLPTRAIEQLRLQDKPDWLMFYEDKADAVTHQVSWGFFYNDIGDSRRAVEYLEHAYSQKPDAPRVVFELTYAYNAIGQPSDAIRVSRDEFAKNPKDELLCREIAFAYLRLKDYRQAVGQYQICIALLPDAETSRAEKSELAVNLSAAYRYLGDTVNRDVWLQKAREWAPKGSPVYNDLHRSEQQ